MLETSDLIFAIDSIPAVIGLSKNPFIIYSSNIFAILGLRALYFVLADVLEKFWALKYGISAVLIFIGVKMLINPFVVISSINSLIVVVSFLTGSLLIPKKA